jgi:hypothetical protein
MRGKVLVAAVALLIGIAIGTPVAMGARGTNVYRCVSYADGSALVVIHNLANEPTRIAYKTLAPNGSVVVDSSYDESPRGTSDLGFGLPAGSTVIEFRSKSRLLIDAQATFTFGSTTSIAQIKCT